MEYKVRPSPVRNNKQSCFYNYSAGGTPDARRTQVHAVPVSGGAIDRSKNNQVVRGTFRAAPQTQQPWPSLGGQPRGKCDADASGSAGSLAISQFPQHTAGRQGQPMGASVGEAPGVVAGSRVRRLEVGVRGCV